jgi:hypothetical protein
VIPVVSLAAVQFGFMLGGSIVIEAVFSMHGVGYLAWESIQRSDLPVIQAIVLMIALFYVVLTFVADLSALSRPRIGWPTWPPPFGPTGCRPSSGPARRPAPGAWPSQPDVRPGRADALMAGAGHRHDPYAELATRRCRRSGLGFWDPRRPGPSWAPTRSAATTRLSTAPDIAADRRRDDACRLIGTTLGIPAGYFGRVDLVVVLITTRLSMPVVMVAQPSSPSRQSLGW